MKQTLRRESNTIFRNHPKDYKFGFEMKALYKSSCMPALEDVERLLFEVYLLMLREVMRQRVHGLIRNRQNSFGQRFLHKLGACGPLDAVRRKRCELGIVLNMVATVRDEKDVALADCIRKPSDIGKQSFSAGHVELAPRQHEINLRIDFPENNIAR